MPVETRHQKSCAKKADKDLRCNCTPTYRAVRYHGKGVPRTIKLFPSHAAARSWLTTSASARQRGPAPIPNLKDAAEALFAGMYSGAVLNRAKQRYKQTAVQTLEGHYNRHVNPVLGDKRLDKIKRKDLQSLVDSLALRFKPATIQNAIKPVAAIYRRAIRDELVTENPVLDLEIERAQGRRERIADVVETKKLIDLLPSEPAPDLRLIFAIASYAGLRRGEILGLEHADIDLDQGVIHVVRQKDVRNGVLISTKSRRPRRVPILSELRKHLLQSTSQTSQGTLFDPMGWSTQHRRIHKVWKDAGVRGITLHECRHSFASICIDAGLNLKVIGSFLGHASITTTMDTYGHLLPGSEKSAGEVMDAYLKTKKGPTEPS